MKVDPGSEAAELLDESSTELQASLDELRELARGLHPVVLTDRGLSAAVRILAGRAPVPVDIAALPGAPLPQAIELAVYFVVAEALTNVAKYAQASAATVSITADDGLVRVEVSDDGIGGADITAGSGLRGLSDRVAALDGRIAVDSPPGEGTRLRAEIPL
jgi:signal transduction histidine kinase